RASELDPRIHLRGQGICVKGATGQGGQRLIESCAISSDGHASALSGQRCEKVTNRARAPVLVVNFLSKPHGTSRGFRRSSIHQLSAFRRTREIFFEWPRPAFCIVDKGGKP